MPASLRSHRAAIPHSEIRIPHSNMLPHPARPLLFLDYDGTLAPIVDDPSKAFPHPEAAEVVRALAERHPAYVVTGRHLDHVAELLGVRMPGIGLHGTQRGMLGDEPESLMPPEAREALDRLRQSVPEREGIVLEDKGESFAVHYRHAPDPDAALAALKAWVGDLTSALVAIWGKSVVELRPASLSKGTAVTTISAEHPGCTPVYLGDDVTDEDAFAALHELDGAGAKYEGDAVTVRVGGGETVARYALDGPAEVVAYLRGFLR
jgi:trehalose 6-phosphate phosphatase